MLIWIGIGMLPTTLFSLSSVEECNQPCVGTRRGITDRSSHDQAVDALRWAGYTYVVAALSSLATLLYYIMIASGNEIKRFPISLQAVRKHFRTALRYSCRLLLAGMEHRFSNRSIKQKQFCNRGSGLVGRRLTEMLRRGYRVLWSAVIASHGGTAPL